MPFDLPNTIANADAVDATPVQGNFDAIQNEIINIESDITTINAALQQPGWTAESNAVTYASADHP